MARGAAQAAPDDSPVPGTNGSGGHMDGTDVEGQRVAIVTGASSGLGRAVALRLARDGFRVALLARDSGALSAVERDVEQGGGTAFSRAVDLAAAAEGQAAVDEVVTAWGQVDVLVNAAGTDVPGSIEQTAVEDWDRVLAVNLRAPFVLSKAVFPHMRGAGGGTIVNVSSVAGLRGWANATAYCSSKFALTGFTQALAAEGRAHGIRACVLYPGAMATSWGVWDPAERRRTVREEAEKPADEALPASQVADLVAWIVTAPDNLVLNEVTVTPLHEQGWP
jgi:NADP-dependent 3-hydroxy acid dehydrogenase YdfG